MCVWSAYVGKRPAAPWLWNSLKKIEGIWAGYYTGMVTTDGQKLYWEKCAGGTPVWEKQFSLDEFKGCCGLIHSRTASGGGAGRAHPYVGADGVVAAVSQGSSGLYASCREKYIAYGNTLLSRGRKCRSGAADQSRSPELNDGLKVCLSDIVVNAVEEEYLKDRDVVRAIRSVCGVLLEESATFFVFRDRPGLIGFVNTNQHVVMDVEPDGTYLSVTSIGVPGYAAELPANSVGYVTADGKIFREELCEEYRNLDSRIPAGTITKFAEYLKANPGVSLGDVCDHAIAPLFENNQKLQFRAAVAYHALEALYFEGHIRFEEADVACHCHDSGGHVFRFYYQE